MRLATFNILHGRDELDDLVEPSRLAASVRALDADVLGLQEVDRNQPRSGGADQAAVAASAMGAVAYRYLPTLSGPEGSFQAVAVGEDVTEGPSYGIALLSRYPVRQWWALRLPRIPLQVPLWHRGRRWVMVDDEPRAALVAEVETPTGPLVVANTHLSLWPGWRWRQLWLLRRRLATYPNPAVILGDLNMRGSRPSRLPGFRPLARHLTVPAARPDRQLDHILLRGNLGVVTATQATAQPISDHRSLAVDITPGPAKSRL